MAVDKYVYSPTDLKRHAKTCHTWGPDVLVLQLMSADGFDSVLINPNTRVKESLQDIVCFGSSEVRSIKVLYKREKT